MPVGKDMLTTIDEIIRIKRDAPQDFGSLSKNFNSLREHFSNLPNQIQKEIQITLKERPFLETFLDPQRSEGITRKNSLGLLDSVDEALKSTFDTVIKQNNKTSSTADLVRELDSDSQSVESDVTEDDELAWMMGMGMGTTRVHDKDIAEEEKEKLRNIGDRAKDDIDIEYLNRAADTVEQSANKDPLDRIVSTLVEMKSIHDKNMLKPDSGSDSYVGKILTKFVDDIAKQVRGLDWRTKGDLERAIEAHPAGKQLKDIIVIGEHLDNQFDIAVEMVKSVDVGLIRDINGVYGRELERRQHAQQKNDEVQSVVEVSKPLASMLEDLQAIKELAGYVQDKRRYTVEMDGRRVGRLTIEGGMLDRIKGVRKAYAALSDDDKAKFDGISHDAMQRVLTDPTPRNLLDNTKALGKSLNMEKGESFLNQLEELSSTDQKLDSSIKLRGGSDN